MHLTPGRWPCQHLIIELLQARCFSWRSANCVNCELLLCDSESVVSLLAWAHPGGPGKRAVKQLWCGGGSLSSEFYYYGSNCVRSGWLVEMTRCWRCCEWVSEWVTEAACVLYRRCSPWTKWLIRRRQRGRCRSLRNRTWRWKWLKTWVSSTSHLLPLFLLLSVLQFSVCFATCMPFLYRVVPENWPLVTVSYKWCYHTGHDCCKCSLRFCDRQTQLQFYNKLIIKCLTTLEWVAMLPFEIFGRFWPAAANSTIFLNHFYNAASVFSALTLLVGHQEEHPVCKKIERWGAGVVICLKRDANDFHMVQLMPLPPHVSLKSSLV